MHDIHRTDHYVSKDSLVTYKYYDAVDPDTAGALSSTIKNDVLTHFVNAINFEPTQALVVTWMDMVWKGCSACGYNPSKRYATFQSVLVTDGISSYIFHNYEKLEYA